MHDRKQHDVDVPGEGRDVVTVEERRFNSAGFKRELCASMHACGGSDAHRLRGGHNCCCGVGQDGETGGEGGDDLGRGVQQHLQGGGG